MLHRRFATLATAVVLGIGVTAPTWAVAAPAFADTATASSPTVTQSGSDFTVNLPGVGSLTFTVDPTTGAISNVVATADPSGGFTPGSPKVSDEGVQVAFTSATGSPQVLQVEVEREDGVVKVKAETETDQPDNQDQAKPEDGNQSTTSTTEVHHEDNQSTTSTTEGQKDSSGSDSSGGSSDGSSGGGD